MKEAVKNILKFFHIYHSLQSFYRRNRNNRILRNTREKYQFAEGEGFECNFCGKKYSQFAPSTPLAADRKALEENKVVAGYGENIICPFCGSSARERFVRVCIEKYISFQEKAILHLAPEKKIFDFLKNKARVTTADLAPGFYKTIDKRIKREDATKLSFADQHFDIVIANHVLEHIPDDNKAMKEFYRVLKPGGIAILQIPYSNKLTETSEQPAINNSARQSALFGQADHVRIYSLYNYSKRLEQSGFTVSVIPAEDSLVKKFALQKEESFFSIIKPEVSGD